MGQSQFKSIGSAEKGLLIDKSTSEVLVQKDFVRFDVKDIELYREKFNRLIELGIIMSDSLFDNHTWKIFGSQYYITFDFEEMSYNPKVYLALKCFTIVQLYDRKIIADSTKRSISNIIKTLKLTSNYDKVKYDDLLEWKDEKEEETQYALRHYKEANLPFLFFTAFNDYEMYIDFFLTIEEGDTRIKEIPSYSNFIDFDWIINDFMERAEMAKKLEFYPILIWWKLTAIIPIRPTEFVEIKNSSIEYDRAEGKYYIEIQRRKQQPSIKLHGKEYKVTSRLQITKELYDTICDYRIKAKVEEEEYLFPYSFYVKFLPRNHQLRSAGLSHFQDMMGYGRIDKLLKRFFDEVVADEYGYKIVKTKDELEQQGSQKIMKQFSLIDTRHLSICSMMMQGYSELTIAQMAGHTHIGTQSSYAAHMEDFLLSHSGLLAKEILQKMNNAAVFSDTDIVRLENGTGLTHLSFRQQQLYSYRDAEPENARKIDFGYCLSKNFPKECFVEDCLFCNKFQINLSSLTNPERAILMGKITKVQDEIQTKINFIKKYYQSGLETSLDNHDSSLRHSKELERNAAMLAILVNRKAVLEAHLLKQQEV